MAEKGTSFQGCQGPQVNVVPNATNYIGQMTGDHATGFTQGATPAVVAAPAAAAAKSSSFKIDLQSAVKSACNFDLDDEKAVKLCTQLNKMEFTSIQVTAPCPKLAC